jgi:hypothetical protein
VPYCEVARVADENAVVEETTPVVVETAVIVT